MPRINAGVGFGLLDRCTGEQPADLGLEKREVGDNQRKLSLLEVFDIFDHATLEDDDEIQDLWANLRAAGMAPDAPKIRKAL